MKSLLVTLLGLGAIAGAGFGFFTYRADVAAEAELNKATAALQQQWTERLGRLRGLNDGDRYKGEMKAQLGWYFSELQTIKNQFPEAMAPDRAWREIELQAASGKIPADMVDAYTEFYEYVREAFEALEAGEALPHISASAENLHFDIYSVKRARYEGEEALKIDFILWGAPREIEEVKKGNNTTTKVVVPLRFSRLFFQFINEAGKVHGEMPATSGEPFIRIDHPERWIPDFPPQALLGSWYVPTFPDAAKSLVWELDVAGKAEGAGAYTASYKWEFEIPSAWKAAGEWGGTETEMPAEYINREPAPE